LPAYPDLHPGRVAGRGSHVVGRGVLSYLIGSDVGCGMGLFATGKYPLPNAKAEEWFKKLKGLENPGTGHVDDG